MWNFGGYAAMVGSLLVIVFSTVQGVPVCSEHCGLNPETNLRPCHKETGKCLYGCVRGQHGDHCDQLCSQNCLKTICNQLNAGCTIGCIDGFNGYFCDKPTVTTVQDAITCDLGMYGENCDLPCSEDCGLFPETNLRPCHKHTGKCLQGCVRGRHGDNCDQLCSQNCIGTTCNQPSGECTMGCTDGNIGYFCNITTVQSGITCDLGKYGENCDLPCSGHCGLFPETNLRPCHKHTGKCLQGCVRGRHGDHCDQLCSPNCIYTTCEQRYGGCTMGCMDGYAGYFCNTTATPSQADLDLFYASRDGNLEEVKRIQSMGVAKIYCRVEGVRWTPLMAAARLGRRGVVEFLVNKGADVKLVDSYNNNVLQLACLSGDVETVKFVLSLNVININSRGKGSRTPIMEAARKGHREVVDLLLSEGADVSLVDEVRNNILHLACWRGEVEMVKHILSLKKWDTQARNHIGQTAADMARSQGHQQLVNLMVSYGAQ